MPAIIFSFAVLILLIGTSFSIPTFGGNSGTTSHSYEDQLPLFTYNFTKNVSETGSPNPDTPWTFSVYAINSSLYGQQNVSFYYWITMNSSSGLMTINTTNDNQSGVFNMTIDVTGNSGQKEGRNFYFIVNASNDAPNITSLNNTYNLDVNQTFILYVNGSDEELHWPLLFNLSFYSNCTRHPFNNRTDCNLFNFNSTSVNSSQANYIPNRYDSGKYFANASVMDFGANYTCSSGYCLANYSQNATFRYPQVIEFNVYSYLSINTTDCQNKIFQENQFGSCIINITSKDIADNITFNSNASLRNNPSGYIPNSTWFYNSGSNFTANYITSVLVNITPQKNAIGNWTINFSALDINFSETNSELIYVYVNRTLNDLPRFKNIPNVNTSISALVTINVTAYDDDNIIPDKSIFNESLNFTIIVVNQSDTSQVINLANYNFTVNITSNPVAGTNRTEGKIQFTPNTSIIGNFSVNITAIDRDNANTTITFNMSIKGNLHPLWDTNLNRTFIMFEHNSTFLNLSQNVTDSNPLDTLSFEYSIDSFFPSFSMNLSNGIINFTPNDSDVGFHIVTIGVTDGFLVNTTTINFTILNINETSVIRQPLSISGTGSSGNSGIGMNASEDSSTIISMYVEDPDLGIIQKSYYNEILTIRTLTISGPNSSLFNFTANPAINNTNYTLFISSSFTPRKADTGAYNITINVSDMANFSDSITFNLTINQISHNPNISTMANQSIIVNRTLYYPINATDVEDGNSAQENNLNFTFRYLFLNGTDFIGNNQSIFNTTNGRLNYTFNSTQAGTYRLLINVTDTSGLNDSKSFWIYVYDIPVILLPSNTTQLLNLFENNSYTLNFTVNHSVGDNLTSEFYLETRRYGRQLRYNISYYGNGTVLPWNFTANFTDESFGMANLTIVTYPSTNSLANATDLNATQTWNITINYTNAPLQFLNNLGGASSVISGGSPQQISLSDYFYDADAADSYHNQTITFTYNTLSSTGTINVNYTNWINLSNPNIAFSSTAAVNANYTITAFEWNESNISQQIRNVTSNIFTVNLSVTTQTVAVAVPTSGGGGGAVTNNVPYSLKIITPLKITGYAGEKMIIPLKLINSGKETFKKINLSAFAFKDKNLENMLKISFDNNTVETLGPGQSIGRSMIVYFKTNKTGDYEITIYANSSSPPYTDWSKIYINLEKINESYVKKYILFTEEFLVQNPSCLELTERLKEADKLAQDGDYSSARAIAEEVLNSCKKNIEQVSIPLKKDNGNTDVLKYFLITCLISVFAGIFYYYFKKRKFSGKDTISKNLLNKIRDDFNESGRTNF